MSQLILQAFLEKTKLAVLTIEKHADGVSVAPMRADASTLMPCVNDEFQKELNIDIKYVLENMQTNAASAEDVSDALGRNMPALGFKDRVSKVNQIRCRCNSCVISFLHTCWHPTVIFIGCKTNPIKPRMCMLSAHKRPRTVLIRKLRMRML